MRQQVRMIGELRSGDRALIGILLSDFFGAIAGAVIHFTMIWWVLAQAVPDRVVGLMVLAIFVPFNLGVLLSGVAVMRFGSRKLLIFSKLIALGGGMSCGILLASGTMTLPLLALVATVTYAALGPSVAADLARVPALTRLAKRGLAGFHALNGTVLVIAQLIGFGIAALMAEHMRPEFPVSLGGVLLALSAGLTWAFFPRDRPQRQNAAPVFQQIRSLTAAVFERLDNRTIGISSIIATTAVIATSEGYSEIILPLDFRSSGLPPTALAGAYGATVIAGVISAAIANAVYGKVALQTALKVICLALLPAVVLAAIFQSTWGLFVAIVLTSAAAWGAGTLTVTTLQESMPVSLQAQAISLWHAFVLAAGALTVLVCGQIGNLSYWLTATLACVAAVASFRQSKK